MSHRQTRNLEKLRDDSRRINTKNKEMGKGSRVQEKTSEIPELSQDGRDVVKWRELTLFVYTAFLGLPPILARVLSRDVTLFSRALNFTLVHFRDSVLDVRLT